MNKATKLMMVAGLVLGFAGSVSAAGFQLIEQSVSGLGNAFAGGAAATDDASTIYFNPAGMTKLKGSQTMVALHLIKPTAEFKNEGSTVSAALGGAALTGGDGGDSGTLGAVPNFYYATELENGAVVGVGVNVPFGLTTEYDDDWVGRYHAIKSALQTVNINPSVAYKFGDVLSVGLGFNIQKLNAELSNAMDFGIYAGASQSADGKLVLEGDSVAYGFNGGLLFEFTEDTTVGVAYRSGMTHDVEGTADFTVPAAVAPFVAGGAPGAFTDCDVTATASLPASFSISAQHNLTPQLVIMADATRTNWSSFKELRFDFADNTVDGVTTENWEDSWRVSAGATLSASDTMLLRFGVAYDETPIPSSEYRTPRIPGGDRTWFALGGNFKLSEAISLDAAYSHLIVNDPQINKTATFGTEDFSRGSLKGTYEATVDIASVQLNYQF